MFKASRKAPPLQNGTKPLLHHRLPKADTQPEPRVTDSIGETTTLPIHISKSTIHQQLSSPLLRSAFRAQTSLEVGLVEALIVCSLMAQSAGVGSYRRCSTVPDMWRMPVFPVLQLATTAPIIISGIPRLGPREVSSRVVVPLSVPSCAQRDIDTPFFARVLMSAIYMTPEQRVRRGNAFTKEGDSEK